MATGTIFKKCEVCDGRGDAPKDKSKRCPYCRGRGGTVEEIPRSVAADVIDEIRQALFQGSTAETITNMLGERFGIPPLQQCSGHENEAYIDNCMRCAPRWGMVGPKIKVK
jgi:RecJ-like exonuclease